MADVGRVRVMEETSPPPPLLRAGDQRVTARAKPGHLKGRVPFTTSRRDVSPPLATANFELGRIPRSNPPLFKGYAPFKALNLASVQFHCTSSFKRCAPRTLGT